MSRHERRQAQRAPSRSFNWVLWGSILLLVLVIGGVVFYNNTKGTGVNYAQYSFTDERFVKPNATVALEEFSDFQCPACQATSPSIKALRDTAPDNVAVRYRNFPLRSIHPYAQKAAEGAECAKEQNRFWAYHDVLMDSNKLTPRELKLHAEGLGLDMTQWNACMDDGKAVAAIERDYREGQQRGVQGTPTIFVNGKLYNGGRTPTEFLAALNAQ